MRKLKCVSNIVILEEDFKIDATDLMIIWLVKEKQKGMQSPVRDYITSMPSQCTLPFLYRPRHLKLFPVQLRQKVENQKKDLLARYEYLDKCFRRHGRGILFNEFQWAATMVLTRSIQAKALTLCKELFEAPWFNNENSHEIALCPFFDLLNHSSENNCDWDFNPVTGSVWVEAVGDIKNSDQLLIDYDQGSDDYMLMNYGFCMQTAANPKAALELSWSEIRKVIETNVTSDVCEVQQIFNRTKIDTEDPSERLIFKIFHNRIPFKFSYIFEEIFNAGSFGEKGILSHKRLTDERLAVREFQRIYLEHLQREILLTCLERRCAELEDLKCAFEKSKLTLDATKLYQIGQILENHTAIAVKWREELASEAERFQTELDIFQLPVSEGCEEHSEIEKEIAA